MAPRVDVRQNRDPAPPTTSVSIRITLEVREALDRIALAESRTMSNVIAIMINESLIRRNTNHRKAKPK